MGDSEGATSAELGQVVLHGGGEYLLRPGRGVGGRWGKANDGAEKILLKEQKGV